MLTAASACSTEAPTDSPEPPPPATACQLLDEAQCARVLEELPGKLPDGALAQYVVVSERLCDGPCFPPGAPAGAWLGHVKVEFLDGREATTFLLEVLPATIEWEAIPTFFVRVLPKSARLANQAVDLTLGHCGLESGIDVDGSFWDPVGMVDLNHPDAINAAEARFTLTSPSTARLETAGGLVIGLARHTGPKYLPGCA